MLEVYIGKGDKRRKVIFKDVDSMDELHEKLKTAVMIAKGEEDIEGRSEQREAELKVELLRAFSDEPLITRAEIIEVMNEDIFKRPIKKRASDAVGKAKDKRLVWMKREGYDRKGNWLGE